MAASGSLRSRFCTERYSDARYLNAEFSHSLYSTVLLMTSWDRGMSEVSDEFRSNPSQVATRLPNPQDNLAQHMSGFQASVRVSSFPNVE